MTVDGPDGDRYSSEPVGDGRDEAGQAATGGNGKNSGPGRHGQDKVGQVVAVTMTVGGPGKNGKSSGPDDNSNDRVVVGRDDKSSGPGGNGRDRVGGPEGSSNNDRAQAKAKGLDKCTEDTVGGHTLDPGLKRVQTKHMLQLKGKMGQKVERDCKMR
ncbi:hypothetical protein BGW80DRAFT_1250855 [Lactifluus volemus]|nr:hypothetical protein BGW80DRAFT_1250855 [Lactifluus volemus]